MWYVAKNPANGKPYSTSDLNRLKRELGDIPYEELTSERYFSLGGKIYTDPVTKELLLGRTKAEAQKIGAFRKRQNRIQKLEGIDRKYGSRSVRALSLKGAVKNKLADTRDFSELQAAEDESVSFRADIADADKVINAPLDPVLDGQPATPEDIATAGSE